MEPVLGIIGIFLFIVCVIVLAASITWVVVKLSPAQSAKKSEPSAT